MSTSIDSLTRDHEQLLGALSCLQRLAERCVEGQPLDAERATSLVELIQDFGCGLHHALEDELLFPLLESRGVAREGGAIGVLCYEHEAFTQALGRLSSAMAEAARGDAWAGRAWARHVDALRHLSSGHMAKEEGVLFPFAAQHLGAKEDTQLSASMTSLESKRFPGLRARLARELPEHLAALGVTDVAPLAPIHCQKDPRDCPRA